LTERALHREHSGGQITHDEFGLQPDDAIASARELLRDAGDPTYGALFGRRLRPA